MVEQVRERSFKTKPQPLGNMKILGQPRGKTAIVLVPGPSKVPTPQFPTGPAGTALKALMLNMLPVEGFSTLPFPMQSGRCSAPRNEILRFPGSKLVLVVGVR